MKTYKTGIIGLGQIAYEIDLDTSREIIWSHAKAFFVHKKTALIMVSDIDKTKYNRFNKYYQNIDYYSNYIEMVCSENIDILSICTPTSTHLNLVKNIAKSKPPKALFVEKPMGNNLNEAIEINNICKESGIILAVNYARQWEKKYSLVRKIIANKDLGDLQTITAYGCTALLTSTSHLIDLFLLFGGDVEWVIGNLQCDYIRKVENIDDPGGIAFVKFKNGVYGFLKGISKNPLHYMFEIDLLFSNGRVTFAGYGEELIVKKFTNNTSRPGHGYKTLDRIYSDKYEIKDNERMLDAVTDIINCIESNCIPKSSGSNALKVHRLIQGIKMSDKNNNIKIYV